VKGLLALLAPERLEWLAGKMLVASARRRVRRMGPDDAHEVRHLYAALVAGNSSDCDPSSCKRDRDAIEAYFGEPVA
jgi:hypothetical protein